MMITPSQIRERKISTVERDGYDRNEVNELLVDIIESYEAVCAENKELYRKMEILANRIEEYREDEDSIKTALISAQKMANRITSEAKDKAEQTLSESAASAQQTVQEARAKADKIVGEAREYVSTLTKEKAQAADEIIADAQEKANSAINSARLVAQDTVEKAKGVASEISEKVKAERQYHQQIVSNLKNESKEFKTTLVSLYETQLGKLKDLVGEADDSSNLDELENQLDSILSDIDESIKSDIIPSSENEPEKTTQEDNAEKIQQENDADAPAEAEEVSQEPEQEAQPNEEESEIDEIIDEIEFSHIELEPDDDGEPINEIDVESALNAFSEDEITPVEDTGATIPIIEDDAEMEPPMPFESFFNVDKTAHSDETISLTAPDEDDEDDSSSKFKGFFKKRK